MTTDIVTALGGWGDFKRYPELRKFWANISDRNLIEFEKSGNGKTSPRLYSVTSAVKARTIWEITRNGRSFEVSEKVGDRAVNLLLHSVSKYEHIRDFPDDEYPCIYSIDLSGKVNSKILRAVEVNNLTIANASAGYDCSIIQIGEIVRNVILNYSEFWTDNLHSRGLLTGSLYGP